MNQQQNTIKEKAASETATTIANNPDIKEEIAKAKKEVVKTKKSKQSDVNKKSATTNKNFTNNFAIDWSAGPDVSSVGLNKAGRIAINYGAGISYALSYRFTLRTGFYVAEKIYS